MEYNIFPVPFADGTTAIFTLQGTQEIQDIGRIFSEDNTRQLRTGHENEVTALHRTIENFTFFSTHEGSPVKQVKLLEPKGEFLLDVFGRFTENTRDELFAIRFEYSLPLFMIGAAVIERQRLSEQAQIMSAKIGSRVLEWAEEMEDPAETLGREAEEYLADFTNQPEEDS